MQRCFKRCIIRLICFKVTIRNTQSQTSRIYNLILKQSVIKQQSLYEHWPSDLLKHGMHPSANWIAWMSSAFLTFPDFKPSDLAFIRISGIPNRFSAIFVVGILSTPLYLSSGSIHPQRFSRTTVTIKFFCHRFAKLIIQWL